MNFNLKSFAQQSWERNLNKNLWADEIQSQKFIVYRTNNFRNFSLEKSSEKGTKF